MPVFRQIEHNSPAYEQAVQLRREILRIPLGLDFSEEELLLEAGEYHLGAYEQNQLLAVLSLKPISASEIKMRQVAVQMDLQKRGVGKQLVLYSENFARSKGYKKIVLHARNTAIDFYLIMGYSITGPEFMEVNIPHYKMYKIIG